jgi:hypothetical protein
LFISSIIFNPLLVISTGLHVPYSHLNRKYINHIHLPYFLHLPSPFHQYPFLPILHSVLHCYGVCSLFSGIFALVFYL